MSILTENIKLYNPFGNRQALLNYILLFLCLIIIYVSLLSVKLNGDTESLKDITIVSYFSFLASMFIIGSLSSKIHLDFYIKPFASCLPDYYKITGIIMLLTGVICSFIYSSLYIAMTPITDMTWVYYLNIFFSCLFVYFVNVMFFLYIKNEYKNYFIFIYIIILIIFLKSVLNGDTKFLFSDYIAYSTIPFIIISLFLMFVLYRSMTRPGFKRRYFSGNNQFSFEPLDPESAPKINEARRIIELPENKSKPGLFERLFLKTLIKTKYLSDARVIIAKEYCTLDKFFTMTGWYSWIIILVGIYLITASLLISGYVPFSKDSEPTFLLLKYVLLPVGIFFLCYKVVSGFTPVYHNLLLPVGRLKQFRNNFLLLITQMAITILWLFLVIVISQIIKDNMKPTSFDDLGISYNPLGFPLLLWPLVIIPALDIFMYHCEKPCSFITMLIFLVVLLTLSIYSIFGVNLLYASISMALAIVISNGFFIDRLYRYWLKNDIELLD